MGQFRNGLKTRLFCNMLRVNVTAAAAAAAAAAAVYRYESDGKVHLRTSDFFAIIGLVMTLTSSLHHEI